MRFLIVFILFAGALGAEASGRAEKALAELDRALDRRTVYIDARQKHIDSLISQLDSAVKPDSGLLMDIADAYTGFDNDSALAYLQRGIDTTEGLAEMEFRWRHASLLPLAGFFAMALDEYASISPDSIPAGKLAGYYDAGRQMNSYIATFFKMYPEVYTLRQNSALEMQKKLLDILPRESAEYKFNLGEYNFLTGQTVKAAVLLGEIVDIEPPGSKFRARAAHHLSTIAKAGDDEDSYIYYLAQSAIDDVLSATREVASLQELGASVNAEGDVPRAHRYLSTAVANAVECGAPLRMIDSSKSLPIIERAHSAHIGAWRRTMYWIMGVMAVLVLVLVGTLLFLRHEMRKMRSLQAKLRGANYAKDIYISQFLQLCSIYMDKLNQFCKITVRKIAAGQADELFRMAKSGKFVEEQSNEFYDIFDNAFLHIYPTFIEEVNSLLRPEERIELREGEKMNTDLRILAFMRLGIEDSSRIAQVLNYSLNTIYAYRNRLKARALNRERFEEDVMKINSSI